jgi:VWFA-related protein
MGFASLARRCVTMRGLRRVASRWNTALLVGAAVALSCAVVRPDPAGARTSPPTLRITTRLVEVNVVVHDKSGAPVSGLNQHDFTIEDDGKKQPIEGFSVTSRKETGLPATPLGTNVFSNHVSRLGSIPQNPTAILLDGRGTEFGDQAYARQQLIRLFHLLRPSDRVALYTLGWHLGVIQDFTGSPSPLIEALRKYSGQPTTASNPQPQTQIQPPSSNGKSENFAQQLSAGLLDMTNLPPPNWGDPFLVLHAIQAIAQHLAGLPGRKSLIWATGRVPLPGILHDRLTLTMPHIGLGENYAFEEEVQSTIRSLNEADVAIYPVNARGLFAGPAYDARASRANPDVAQDLIAMYGPTQGMIYWASHTGGEAFHDDNNLTRAIRRAMDDCQLTYAFSYHPNDARWKGEYHNLKVRVDRKHVQVRYRLGYYATSGEAMPKAKPLAELKSAAESPLDETEVGLTVRILPVGSMPTARFKAQIQVSTRGIAFQSANGRKKASFEIWAGQYSSQGRLLRGLSNNVSVDLSENEYQQIQARGGFPISLEDKVEPQTWQLRIAVRDAATGALGSVRVPLASVLRLGP